MSNIYNHQIFEGNLKAERDATGFCGPNMWQLYLRDNEGRWTPVSQWMSVPNIQRFFNTKFPVYKEISSTKYQLES